MLVAAVIATLLVSASTPLNGTVVAPDGTPIVGAEVVLTDPTPGNSPVVARDQSGEGGRFRLERPADLVPKPPYLFPTLWAVAPGRRLAVIRFRKGVPAPQEPVRVVLEAPVPTEVRVLSPDGKPVVGARVNVQRIRSEPMPLPEPIYQAAERTTGADGTVALDAFGPREVGSVDVIAEGYGIQPRWLDAESSTPKRVRLLPVVKVAGQLVPEKDAGKPEPLEGWRIRAWTNDNPAGPRGSQPAGYASANTDAEGRFRFSELAPGTLRLAVIPQGESDLLPDVSGLLRIRPEGEDSLQVPLRRASSVTGVFREHGTGKPVAGVRLSLNRPGASSNTDATTDAQGRFRLRTLEGKANLWGSTAPPGYVNGAGGIHREIDVPGGAKTLDLGVFEVLRAAPPVRGVVRDENGRPVGGAEVVGKWTAATPLGGAGGQITLKADDEGRFALEDLAPGSQIEITARHHERATTAPVRTVADADDKAEASVVVTIVSRPVVAVTGRVVDAGGRPVEGIVVRLRSRQVDRNPPDVFGTEVRPDGDGPIRTGPDGTFRTPKELERDGREYQAEVIAEGYHQSATPWTPTTRDADVLTLTDLRLRATPGFRVVTGRVVDRDDRPIPGVRVFQSGDGPRPSSTTTDEAGRFRLIGVYSGPALVVAEKRGFRFGGVAVEKAEDGVVEIRLNRDDQPPVRRLKTLFSPMDRAEERALGRELLAPVIPQALAAALGYEGAKAIPTLARLDPERALTMLEDRVVPEPTAVLIQVALAQLETDPAAAVATLEADLDPATRSRGFLALADAQADPDQRDRWLGRALADARRASNPVAKLKLLAQVARRWLELGDLEHAAPILREGKAVRDAIPKEGFFDWELEQFGELLAAVDLPAARAIFERKGVTRVSTPNPDEIRRHLGQASLYVAPFDPAEAERLLAEGAVGPNLHEKADLTFRVARRMARTDLPRARKLLKAVADLDAANPPFARSYLLPYGLGLLAAERASTDAEGARALLDEAIAGLVALARESDEQTSSIFAIATAALLPVVERLDPDRLSERLWLAASLRPPRTGDHDRGAVQSLAILALLASRYDRQMADAIASPAIDRLPSLLEKTQPWPSVPFGDFQILAAYDPRIVAELLPSFPASARKTERTKDGQVIVASEVTARLAAAEMLGRPIVERRREAQRVGLYSLVEHPDAQ